MVFYFRHHWKDHVLRMSDERIPKLVLNYKPIGNTEYGKTEDDKGGQNKQYV